MGSFVTDAVLQSPTEVHGSVNVLEHGEHRLEPNLRPLQHMEPSYESAYQEVHKAEFDRICSLVQTPNTGPFMHTDLTWASHLRVKGRRTDPRNLVPVSVAYIPWARVDDFVKGEEARSDAPCKFVCQGTPTNLKGKLTFPRWNSYSAIIRYVCNMQFVFLSAFFDVTISCHISSLLYMTLTVSTCCPCHPTGIIVNMDQMTMPRTYQWLQMTCTRRNENST